MASGTWVTVAYRFPPIRPWRCIFGGEGWGRSGLGERWAEVQGKRTGNARERRVNRMRAKALLGKYMGETYMREKSVGEMCMGEKCDMAVLENLWVKSPWVKNCG